MSIEPETPQNVEDVLLDSDYEIVYKDEFVCSVEHKKNHKQPPINIPQDTGRSGLLHEDIVAQILFDANIREEEYWPKLEKIKRNRY